MLNIHSYIKLPYGNARLIPTHQESTELLQPKMHRYFDPKCKIVYPKKGEAGQPYVVVPKKKPSDDSSPDNEPPKERPKGLLGHFAHLKPQRLTATPGREQRLIGDRTGNRNPQAPGNPQQVGAPPPPAGNPSR